MKHDEDDVSVECLEGRITVQCRSNTDLVDGEAVSCSEVGLGEKVTADAETTAAWRRGLLLFKDRSLADVVSDLSRHRCGKLVIASGGLRSRRMSGGFHLDRPNEIRAHLEETLQVRPVHLIGGIVLLAVSWPRKKVSRSFRNTRRTMGCRTTSRFPISEPWKQVPLGDAWRSL